MLAGGLSSGGARHVGVILIGHKTIVPLILPRDAHPAATAAIHAVVIAIFVPSAFECAIDEVLLG